MASPAEHQSGAGWLEEQLAAFLDKEDVDDVDVVYVKGPSGSGKSTAVLKFIWDYTRVEDNGGGPLVVYLMETPYETAVLGGYLESPDFEGGALAGKVLVRDRLSWQFGGHELVLTTFEDFASAMESSGEALDDLEHGVIFVMDMVPSRPVAFEISQAIIARWGSAVVGLGSSDEHDIVWLEQVVRRRTKQSGWKVPVIDMADPTSMEVDAAPQSVAVDLRQPSSLELVLSTAAQAVMDGLNIVCFWPVEDARRLHQLLLARLPRGDDGNDPVFRKVIHRLADEHDLDSLKNGAVVRSGSMSFRARSPWMILVVGEHFSHRLHLPKVGLVLAGGRDNSPRRHEATGRPVSGPFWPSRWDISLQQSYAVAPHAAGRPMVLCAYDDAALANLADRRPSQSLGVDIMNMAIELTSWKPGHAIAAAHEYAEVVGGLGRLENSIALAALRDLVVQENGPCVLTRKGRLLRELREVVPGTSFNVACLVAGIAEDVERGKLSEPAARTLVRLAAIIPRLGTLLWRSQGVDDAAMEALHADAAGPARGLVHHGKVWAALGLWEKLRVDTAGFELASDDGAGGPRIVADGAVALSWEESIAVLEDVQRLSEALKMEMVPDGPAGAALSSADLFAVQMHLITAFLDSLIVFDEPNEDFFLYGTREEVMEDPETLPRASAVASAIRRRQAGQPGSPGPSLFVSFGLSLRGSRLCMHHATAIDPACLVELDRRKGLPIYAVLGTV